MFPNSTRKITRTSKPTTIEDVDGLYELLEVEYDASQEEIRRAARQKMLESHPDNGGSRDRFEEVYHAYDVLSHPASRAKYDLKKSSSLTIDVRQVDYNSNMEVAITDSKPMAFYKDASSVLTPKALEWQQMVLEVAYEYGLETTIETGVSKSLPGYVIENGIALKGIKTIPERWAAQVYVSWKQVNEYVNFLSNRTSKATSSKPAEQRRR